MLQGKIELGSFMNPPSDYLGNVGDRITDSVSIIYKDLVEWLLRTEW